MKRKVKVHTKLAKRHYRRQDSITKGGLIFVASFILPCCFTILFAVLFTKQTISFGSF